MLPRSKGLSGPTQLLAMALEGTEADSALLALPPESGLPRLFERLAPRLGVLYHDYAVFRRDREVGYDPERVRLSFAPHLPPDSPPFDLALVYLPRGREYVTWVFSSVSRVLEPGARVMVVGSKRAGIRSCRPLLEEAFGPVESTRSARHSALMEARRTLTAEPFAGERRFETEAFGQRLQVVTLPGVFSHGELDEGTRFLLDHFRPRRFETALDWGSGSGVIGVALALAWPERRVDLVDSSVMALEATRLTLEANGLDAGRVRASDVFSDVPERYDLIVSNPPFHSGPEADFSVTERLIRDAPRHLSRSGRLVLVANAFINYFRHLRPSFKRVRTLAEDGRYRLLEASGPI